MQRGSNTVIPMKEIPASLRSMRVLYVDCSQFHTLSESVLHQRELIDGRVKRATLSMTLSILNHFTRATFDFFR